MNHSYASNVFAWVCSCVCVYKLIYFFIFKIIMCFKICFHLDLPWVKTC